MHRLGVTHAYEACNGWWLYTLTIGGNTQSKGVHTPCLYGYEQINKCVKWLISLWLGKVIWVVIVYTGCWGTYREGAYGVYGLGVITRVMVHIRKLDVYKRLSVCTQTCMCRTIGCTGWCIYTDGVGIHWCLKRYLLQFGRANQTEVVSHKIYVHTQAKGHLCRMVDVMATPCISIHIKYRIGVYTRTYRITVGGCIRIISYTLLWCVCI